MDLDKIQSMFLQMADDIETIKTHDKINYAIEEGEKMTRKQQDIALDVVKLASQLNSLEKRVDTLLEELNPYIIENYKKALKKK